MNKQYGAQCYYVKHQPNDWWGYFTVVPELGLLQIHSDFGIFAHRWSAPGPDFKAFLVRMGSDYLAGCLASTVPATVTITSQKTQASVERRIQNLINHLWPLFIEQLKQEKTEAGVS